MKKQYLLLIGPEASYAHDEIEQTINKYADIVDKREIHQPTGFWSEFLKDEKTSNEQAQHYSGGIVTFMVVELNDNELNNLLAIIGPNDPQLCEDFQLRRKFGSNRIKNAIHFSIENQEHELELYSRLKERSEETTIKSVLIQ